MTLHIDFDYPSHVPSERAANSRGVRYLYSLFYFGAHFFLRERFSSAPRVHIFKKSTQLRVFARNLRNWE